MSRPEPEGEQAIAPKVAKDPGQPSAQEIADHAVTHLPYRSWCPHCVRGKGRNFAHFMAAAAEREIPVLAADYCFMCGDGSDLESPVLVMADTATAMIFAHAVDRKGADAEVMNLIMADMEVLGHREIVFKTDQEPAMKAIQEHVAARRPGIKLENSPVEESQANGVVENAILRV